MKDDSKSKNKYIIFILIGILIIIGVFLFTTNNINRNNNSPISYNGNAKTSTSLMPTTKNINFEKVAITKNGDFIIKVTNNNSTNVAIYNIVTIFKDSEGNFMEKVESNCTFACIPANSFTYIYNKSYDRSMAQYDNYEFSCEILDNYNDGFVYSGIEINANDTGKQISVTAKNNSGKDLSRCNIVVLFYNSDEIVGISEGFGYDSIVNGSNYYFNVDYPEDTNYKKIPFDKYEVYYVGAEI